MLNTKKEIIEACDRENIRIYDLVLREEIKNSKESEEEIRKRLSKIVEIMEESTFSSDGGEGDVFLIMDRISPLAKKRSEEDPLVGKFLMKAMAMALSTSEVNYSMGKIVAAPTAGSSGIMAALITSMKERYDPDEEDLQNGLLTAIGIGQIIGKYATFAGAEGGCQAECGSAASMGAACAVEILGGSPEMVLDAASFSLINVMGLVCDPIAGLVQYPCIFRNASGLVNAMLSADLALSGIRSIVPFEEVVRAMKEVGESMPESLRETGLGGLAGTATGKRIRRNFLGDED